ATSSVFLATSLTSSAPIFSYGSSSSISRAMETPSLVMVGAPQLFSKTTLRPFGPSVTFTASARVLRPLSRPRRASSSKAIIFAIVFYSPRLGFTQDLCLTQAPATAGLVSVYQPQPGVSNHSGTLTPRVQEKSDRRL